jgi:hypothetical protein
MGTALLSTRFLSGTDSGSGISWPWIKFFQELVNKLASIDIVTGLFTAGGDLSGTNTTQKVIGIEGIPFAASVASPTNGQAIIYDSVLNQYKAGAPPASFNFADEEVPQGAIDGLNSIFTFSHSPNPQSSLMWFKNGVLQTLNVDYALTANVANYFTVPSPGDTHVAWYRF